MTFTPSPKKFLSDFSPGCLTALAIPLSPSLCQSLLPLPPEEQCLRSPFSLQWKLHPGSIFCLKAFDKNLSSFPRALDHSLEKPKPTTWPPPHHCQPSLLLPRRFTDVPNCSIFEFLLGIFPSCYFLKVRKLTRPKDFSWFLKGKLPFSKSDLTFPIHKRGKKLTHLKTFKLMGAFVSFIYYKYNQS